MRVLITGGAGFIGSHVAEELLRRGDEPFVLDNFSGGSRENLPSDVPVFEADIRDENALSRVFNEVQPQAVCHYAANVSVGESVRNPVGDAEVNVLGTIRVLSQCVDVGVQRVVFASSGGALYGNVFEPVDENAKQQPISPYGIGKLVGERYLECFARTHRFTGVALRFSNVYGPRQASHGEGGVVAIFSRRLLAAEQITINGDGKYFRDFIEVTDVARATADSIVVNLTKPFVAWNIGFGSGIDVNELSAAMRPICEDLRLERGLTSAIPNPAYGPPREGDIRSNLLSAAAARDELGWTPEIDLKAGLCRTIAWFAKSVPN